MSEQFGKTSALQEQLLSQFLRNYYQQLKNLVRFTLHARARTKEGTSAVVQDALKSFVEAPPEWVDWNDPDSLLRALRGYLRNKVDLVARKYRAQKRDVRREVRAPTEGSEDQTDFDFADATPTPEEALLFIELIESLPEDQRRAVQLRMEGCDNQKIAEVLQCSERKVHRLFASLKARLQTREDNTD